MKVLVVSLLLLFEAAASAFFPSERPASEGFFAKAIEIKILPSSSLSILGTTNVNKFSCLYCDELFTYSRNVRFDKEENTFYFDQATLKLNSTTFDCGIRQMNKDFQELLNAEKYPHLTLKLQEAKLMPGARPDEGRLMVACMLNLSGIERLISFPVSYSREDQVLNCTGEAVIYLPNFNIEPPTKMMGLVKVEEKISVHFDLAIATE